MFKKVILTAVIAMFLTGGLAMDNPVEAAPMWKGPKGSLPERPIYPSSKLAAYKRSLKEKILECKWNLRFHKYKGYGADNVQPHFKSQK